MRFCSIIEPPIIHKPHRKRHRRIKQFFDIRRHDFFTFPVKKTPDIFEIFVKTSPEVPLPRIASLFRRRFGHMREVAIKPQYIFLPCLRLFDLQSSPSIATVLEISISEHKSYQDISLLFCEITQHTLSILDFPADCLLGSVTLCECVGRSPKRFPAPPVDRHIDFATK